MLDRIHLREIDWALIALALLNAAIGVVLIDSAARVLPGAYAVKQAVWVLVGLALLFLSLIIDYKMLLGLAPYAYGVILAVLALLLVFGRVIGGARSWLRVASFGGQPSELAKLAVVLMLARLFAEYKRPEVNLSFTLLTAAIAGAPMLLIALQPDMGTAMSIIPIGVGALILAGLNRRTVVLFLAAAVLLGALGWQFVLRDYQKTRIQTVLNPLRDARGAGYHVLQSKIAIGSGGLAGKGYGKGSQSQLRFLPARHTDFVFSVLGEEFGFLGVLAVLASYLALLTRIFRSTAKSRDRPGVYIVFLCGCMIAFPFLINVLMIVGLFPITGVPIPLLSYGGSSVLATFLAVALVINVRMRRFANV